MVFESAFLVSPVIVVVVVIIVVVVVVIIVAVVVVIVVLVIHWFPVHGPSPRATGCTYFNLCDDWLTFRH